MPYIETSPKHNQTYSPLATLLAKVQAEWNTETIVEGITYIAVSLYCVVTHVAYKVASDAHGTKKRFTKIYHEKFLKDLI